ncbi:Basic blue protein-like protein [Drosera capensis]
MESDPGRGNATQTLTVMVGIMFLCLLLQFDHAHGAIYIVGGTGGWGFGVSSWPKGKTFKAGDVLVFNYDSSIHIVVRVDKSGYNSCSSPTGAKAYSTGSDRINLAKGMNYFICSYPGHCQAGMKIAINAT